MISRQCNGHAGQHVKQFWVCKLRMSMQEMAEVGTTAQVHPQKLTTAFMEAAQASGAKLVRGTVQGITVDKDSNSVTGDCMPFVLLPVLPCQGCAWLWFLFRFSYCLPPLSHSV